MTTGADSSAAVDAKQAQLRKLWDTTVVPSKVGGRVAELVTADVPGFTQAVFDDKEAFDLAVDAVRPWLVHETDDEILDATVESDTVERVLRLVKRLAVLAPSLGDELAELSRLVGQMQGKRLLDALGPGRESGDLSGR